MTDCTAWLADIVRCLQALATCPLAYVAAGAAALAWLFDAADYMLRGGVK